MRLVPLSISIGGISRGCAVHLTVQKRGTSRDSYSRVDQVPHAGETLPKRSIILVARNEHDLCVAVEYTAGRIVGFEVDYAKCK